MASPNLKFLSIRKALFKESNFNKELLSYITGHSIMLFEHLSDADILIQLSYLIQQQKELDRFIYQDVSETPESEVYKYKLEAKNRIATYYIKSKSFGTKPVVFEMLKIMAAAEIALKTLGLSRIDIANRQAKKDVKVEISHSLEHSMVLFPASETISHK